MGAYLFINDPNNVTDPSLRKDVYIPFNTNRTQPRTTIQAQGGFTNERPNYSINLHTWLDYVGQIDSAVSNGTYATDVAAVDGGLEPGQFYYNSTNEKIQVVPAYVPKSVVTIAADDAITVAEHAFALVLLDGGSATADVTLPAAADADGVTFYFRSIDGTTNQTSVAPDGAEDLDGANSAQVLATGDTLTVISDGTEWYSYNI